MKRSRNEEDTTGIRPQRAAGISEQKDARDNCSAEHDAYELSKNNANQNQPARNATIARSLPPEVIVDILSFYSDSLEELVVCSRISTSWKKALSKVERVRLEVRQNNINFSSIREMLQNVNDLTIFDGREKWSSEWNDISRFIGFYSRQLKHFKFYRDHSCKDTTIDDAFDCLVSAAQLESLTFENSIFGEIVYIIRMLQNKPRLKKLKLVDLLISAGVDEDIDATNRLEFPFQIGKMHTLRELHLTGYFDAFSYSDPNILFSGLKNLQYLHVCVPSEETLLAINCCCPVLEHLHIADYGSTDSEVRLEHLMSFLHSSKIQTLDICSSLYEDTDDVCTIDDIIGLCSPSPSTTLRRLIVSLDTSMGDYNGLDTYFRLLIKDPIDITTICKKRRF